MFGNLLSISLDGSFSDPLWCTVSDLDEVERNVVYLEMCSELNKITDMEAIFKIAHSNGRAVMIESPVYFFSFQPVLTAIQEHKNLNDVWPEIISPKTAHPQRPKHLRDDTPVQSSTVGRNRKLIVGDFARPGGVDRLIDAPSLDSSQLEAIQLALTNRLSIIQGPPGTGKTFIGLKLVEILLATKALRGPIVVLTYK